jgi:hypothetical protein
MQYNGLVIGMAIIALVLLAVAVRLLLRRGWLLGWLRGTTGLLMVGGALFALLLANDLRSYRELPASGETLLTVSFQQAAEQSYDVTIEEKGQVAVVPLNGDLWQRDVRVLRWKGLAALIGLQPGYRLDQLNGRFLSAEQESAAAGGNRVLLSGSSPGVDLWRWLRENRRDFGLFEPWGGRVSFQPMADRAVYRVSLGTAGLMVEPVSVAAREAAAKW